MKSRRPNRASATVALPSCLFCSAIDALERAIRYVVENHGSDTEGRARERPDLISPVFSAQPFLDHTIMPVAAPLFP
jgi:hypothetical protein